MRVVLSLVSFFGGAVATQNPDHAHDHIARARRAECALVLLNIFLSDVRYGRGAYLGVYLLTEHGWDQASIGFALSLGRLAGLLNQTPIGVMVDAVRAKRLLLAVAVGVALF